MQLRPRTSPALLALLVALTGPIGAALAQEDDAAQGDREAAPDDGAAPGPRGRSPAADPAEVARLYEDAFRALAAGDPARARALMEAFAARTGDPERGAVAREVLRALGAAGARLQSRLLGGAPGPVGPPAGRRLDRSGRAELIVTSTLLGTWTAIAVSILADVEDPRIGAALTLAATGAAMAASWQGTEGMEITKGEAMLYTTGALYGAWTGLALGLLTDDPLVDGGSEDELLVGATLLGSLAGAAAGYGAGHGTRLSPGDAELIRTGGLWGTVSATLLLGIVQPGDVDVTVGMLLAGSDGGLAVGAALAPQLELSRGRLALIDLGAFVGLLGGGLVDVILLSGASGDDEGILRAGTGIALAGWWVGGLVAGYLTRSYDTDNGVDVQTALLERDAAGRLHAGVPLPMVVPTAAPEERRLGLAATVGLLGGSF